MAGKTTGPKPTPPPASPAVPAPAPAGVDGGDLDALESPGRFVPTSRTIDDRITRWVEGGYQHWENVSKDWRVVTLSSEAAATNIVDDARHYAGKIRETPLTVQVREVTTNPDDGTAALVYRVRTRVKSGRKPTGE